MALTDGQIKAVVGRNQVVWWWPTEPIDTASEAPSLTVHLTGGDEVVSLTAIGGSTGITAITADRRTLSPGSPIGSTHEGIQGDHGGFAWLHDPGGAGSIPIKVQSFKSTGVYLADTLPGRIDIVDSTLEWYAYHATLSSANVTATADRNIRWTLKWSRKLGADMPAEPRQLRGVLHVVNQPFSTGLMDENLHTLVPGFAQMVPRRQDSWGPQRRLGLRWIERELRRNKLVEDNAEGGSFLQCHAFITAHYILNGLASVGSDRADAAALWLDKAREEFEAILENQHWYDADGDGVVDSGEEDYEAAGPSVDMFRSFCDGHDTDFVSDSFPKFTRLQVH